MLSLPTGAARPQDNSVARTTPTTPRGQRRVRPALGRVDAGEGHGRVGLLADCLLLLIDGQRANDIEFDAMGLDGDALIGVEMIEKEVVSAFEKNHILRVDPMGQKFDPNFHEAMFEVPDTGKPAGTVVQVLAPGYVLRDRLLRAAMVGVAKGGAPEAHKPIDTTA